MKPKVLIFHPYLAPYRVDLYNALSKDFDILVLLTGGQKEISTLGFNLNLVNSLAQFKYIYVSKGLRIGRHLISHVYWKTIKSFRPNIIISHELGINTLISIYAKTITGKIKLFTTIDDSPIMASNYGFKREILRRFVAKYVDSFIVVNPQVKDLIESKYRWHKGKSIYMPIIQNDEILEDKINKAQHKAQDLEKTYDLRDKKIILFVGRLETIKAPELLVDTFIKLGREDTLLVIVGHGSLYEVLKDKVRQTDRKNIILTGMLSGEDLYAWYYLANIFVLPSRFEPFGAVVNEALVAGCYTIVSEKVGASALVGSQNGAVVNVEDCSIFESVLKSAIEHISLNKKHRSLMLQPFIKYYEELKRTFSLS